ncbi:hypothetical protein ACFYT4_17785 [Streptomyces sp. NPDC004609]|uniref:hypothetical protein n=1 Tax=Streptomyces sp. NPDC004609 TaxID=3364704 RepID=UPI003682750B
MPTPAVPSSVQDVSPRIEYRHFQLVDEGAVVAPPEGWAASSGIVVAGGRGVVLRTGGNDFYPYVRIEAFPEAPLPGDESLWEVVEEAGFVTVAGTVLLREWDGGPVGSPVRIGGPGAYRLRAHCRGRAEAALLVGEELYYEGVEEWLLWIWPLKAPHP